MKEEMEWVEKQERQLLSIVQDNDIRIIHISNTSNDENITIPWKGIATIPTHLTMKWVEFMNMNRDNRIDTIHINIRPISSSYHTSDLLRMIETFGTLPSLRNLFLDGWDEVCEREQTFEQVRESLLEFLEDKNNFFLRFYMDIDTYRSTHFDRLNAITIIDNDWD
jgi:hypothetical protein